MKLSRQEAKNLVAAIKAMAFEKSLPAKLDEFRNDLERFSKTTDELLPEGSKAYIELYLGLRYPHDYLDQGGRGMTD